MLPELLPRVSAEAEADLTLVPAMERGNWGPTAQTLMRHEREAQDRKWGQQNHPSFLNDIERKLVADLGHSYQDRLEGGGGVSWFAILMEELGELARARKGEIIPELTQVAAVTQAWLESELRRMQRECEQAGELEYDNVSKEIPHGPTPRL